MNRYKSIIVFLVLTPAELLSQVNGYIFDSVDKNPIPFVNIWVQDENSGTTSDKKGFYEFENDLIGKNLVISSIGYERKIVTIDTNYLEIYLSPVTYSIPEINIQPKKNLEIRIGKYRKTQVNKYTSPMGPQIFARYFEFKEEYSLTPFISSIKLESFSKTEAIFNLRLLSVDSSGFPGNDILAENHLIKVREGRRSNQIKNLAYKHLVFPEEGMFVAVEFLIIKENEFKYKSKNTETGEISEGITYMPFLGVIKTDSEKEGWVYRWGKWYKDLGKSTEEMGDDNVGHFLAVEITLTN
ncbi:MAG TPA: carboxypeptidase-like regulatory domain-containing protein [Bacteroidales bacterium]|nr:carboxypeptidase-like regulatory domain-containing protein [Bacteroidales bacterium]